jgi:hypothetical protein
MRILIRLGFKGIHYLISIEMVSLQIGKFDAYLTAPYPTAFEVFSSSSSVQSTILPDQTHNHI